MHLWYICMGSLRDLLNDNFLEINKLFIDFDQDKCDNGGGLGWLTLKINRYHIS